MLLLSIYFNNVSYGQYYRNYNEQNGLPGNRINQILQDKTGHMWFATDRGIYRYDGYEFIGFTNYTHGIKSNYIAKITELNDSTILFKSDKHLYTVNTYNLKLEQYSTPKYQTHAHFSKDKSGKVWSADNTNGIFTVNKEDSTFYPFQGVILGIHLIKNDIIIVSRGSGFWKLNKQKNGFTKFGKGKRLVSTSYLDKNKIWVGLKNNGFAKINAKGKIKKVYNTTAEGEPLTYVHDIKSYNDSVLIINAEQGLFLFYKKQQEIKKLSKYYLGEEILKKGFVETLEIDREGGIWLGSLHKGVHYFSPYLKAQQEHFKTLLPGANISNVIKLDSSRFIVQRTEQECVIFNYYNETLSEAQKIPGCQKLTSAVAVNNVLFSINEEKNNLNKTYWNNNGVKQEINVLKNTDFKGHEIKMLHGVNDTTLLLLTDKCVYRYNSLSSELLVVTPFDNINITHIVHDRRDKIWIVKDNRDFIQLGVKHNKLLKKNFIPQSGLRIDNMIHYGNIIWIATNKGLYRFDATLQHYELVSDLSFMANEKVTNISIDGNFVWLTAGDKLVHLPINQKGFQLYSKSDGIGVSQFLTNTSFQIKDQIFFGSPEGILHFKPQEVERNFIKPAPILEKLVAANELTNEHNVTYLPYKNRTHIKHNYNNIRFSFSALSYTNPKNNQYDYALEGYNSNWKRTTNNSVVFNNLKPGKYTFKLKASNGDGVWSYTMLTSHFTIKPPFWLTTVAYIVYSFLFIVFVFVAYSLLRKQAIKQSEQKQERINFLKEQELNQFKINFFTNLAHEIKTPVSLIKTPLEFILNKKDIEKSPLLPDLQVMFNNTERLTSLVEELLEFRKIESGKYELRRIKTHVNKLVSDVFQRFTPFAERKGIKLKFIDLKHEVFVKADQEALIKVVSNLLTNAFKFAKSKVAIKIEQDADNKVLINVEDDGPGIPEDKVQKIFEPYSQLSIKDNFKGVGIGLAFAKSLVELNNGDLIVKSTGNNGTRIAILLKQMQADSQSAEIQKDEEKTVKVEEPKNILPQAKKDDKPIVLVAEDNEELRAYLIKIFREEYRVIEAENGKAALEELAEAETEPAIIVTDVMMPEMSGIELCAYIKSTDDYSHIPVVMLTAKSKVNDRIEGLSAGADAYITKPFNIAELKAQVQSILLSRQNIYKRFNEQPEFEIKKSEITDIDKGILEKVVNIINENLDSPDLNTEFICQEIGFSRSKLVRKIKALTGNTVNDYIRIVRLQQSVKYIEEGRLSLKEIAYKTGFSSLSYFSRTFKKQYGKAPSEL